MTDTWQEWRDALASDASDRDMPNEAARELMAERDALAERVEKLERALAAMVSKVEGPVTDWNEARAALLARPSHASDDAADARRFRWLLPRFTAADFEYGEPNPIAVVAFAWPRAPISADLRRSIDDAMKLEATSKARDSTPGSLRDADGDAGNSDALK